MPQYFIKSDIAEGSLVSITGDDCHHLVHVRRVRSGEKIFLRSLDSKLYSGIISDIKEDEIAVKVDSLISEGEMKCEVILACALLKGKNFELVIQKAVEVGVTKIIPLASERCIPDVKGKEKDKLERWNKIALEAAKQCLRSDIPVVDDILSFKELVNVECGSRVICHTSGGVSIEEAILGSAGDRYLMAVGPEGGFSDKEIALAKDAGWDVVTFGFSQLRAETAAIVLPAILINEIKTHLL